MKYNNRFLATLTALCLLGTLAPAAALAAEGQEAGHLEGCGYVCSHIHSGECGFAAAVEGRACTDVHVHDGDCGYAEASEEVNCMNGNCDGTENGHVEHQDAVSAADCAYVHEHGAECGFAAETEGSPCSHVCGEDEWVCAEGCTMVEDGGEEPLPAQVAVELEAEADRTYTLSGVQECSYFFSGAGTVVLEDVVIAADEGFSAVTLADGAEVTVEISGACILTGGAGGAGIAVPASAILTLTGSGSLTATGNGGTDEGGLSGAGIGGTYGQGDSGVIHITGLTGGLTARGYGVHACGIGSAYNGSSMAINITRSVIAEAVGGFEQNDQSSDYGVGIVTKYGNNDPEGGAAIGGGGKAGDCGDITITDSTVAKAWGGSKSAAIGGTCWADCGDITVTGSTLLDVLGGCTSAGIGVGRVSERGRDTEANAQIAVVDSTVSARGGVYGAAIGTGYNSGSAGNRKSEGVRELAITTVEISSSQISAVGGNGGAGIGGGYKGYNTEIAIDSASRVYAQGGVLAEKADILENGACGIGAGANGSGVFSGGVIAIAAGADVTAVSNGGKWAVDIDGTRVQGVENVYQNRFLVEDGKLTIGAEGAPTYVKNPADDCTVIDPAVRNTVTLGEKTVDLPAGYICGAATQSGSGVYQSVTADKSQLFSQYGSSAESVDYAEKATAEELGKAAVDMAAGSDLRANSYLYVALRGDEVPPAPVVPDEPSPASYRITVNYLEAATGDSLAKPYTRRLSDGGSYDVTARASLEIDGYVIDHVDGETTGTLDRDVVVDVYYVKETQFTDPETPTGPTPPVAGPESPDVTMDDGGVPTSALPELPTGPDTPDETVILEEEIPLGDLPQTGTTTLRTGPAAIMGLAALALSMTLAGVTVLVSRKREDAE